MKRVLILCTGNSCRSQMAEALWNQHGAGQWVAVSAGSNPTGVVHPLAIAALRELDIDTPNARSKHVSDFAEQPFDLVVTVCDNARQACPVFPGAQSVLHWPFEDPADAAGDEASRAREFARIRDLISQRIQRYLQTIK